VFVVVATTLGQRLVSLCDRAELWLLSLAVALYIVGDMVTSALSVLLLGAYEANQVVVFFLDTFGGLGLVLHKLPFALLIAVLWIAIARLADRLSVPTSPFRAAIFALFAGRGAVLVAWNCYVIVALTTGRSAIPWL
jgi:hypothetical protein